MREKIWPDKMNNALNDLMAERLVTKHIIFIY